MLAALLAWAGSTISGVWLKVGAGAAAIFALLIIAFELMAMGRAQEKSAEQERLSSAIQNRKATEDAVNSLSDSDLDKRLSDWVRPEAAGK